VTEVLGDRYCFMKRGADRPVEHLGYADGSPCSNPEGLARVWDSAGYGACPAHLEALTKRKKGKSK
jgi:hypothetical protein